MKISNEGKVGLLAIIAIIILVIGFNFLKGKKLFTKEPVLFAEFKNLGSLEKSNSVKINGLVVGTVYNFVPKDKEVSSIIVEIHLTRDVLIPRNSVAVITGSPLGSSSISVKKGTSNEFLKSGDTIPTNVSGDLLGDLKEQLAPTMSRINETLDSLKFAIGSINSIFDPSTNRNLQTLIAHMTISAASLQKLLNAESGALAQTLGNMNAVSSNLAKNNDAITHSIRNVEITTSSLANARIQETVAALEGTIKELQGAAGGLKGSIDKINSPNGTLGALMNDRKLYDQLNKAALGLEILLDDVRVHPKRYVNISVFGGKSKPDPLTSPTAKDTIPANRQ
jgi:phospholipid/cholesterol/gamma-HCH transport system substrate-binding protein